MIYNYAREMNRDIEIMNVEARRFGPVFIYNTTSPQSYMFNEEASQATMIEIDCGIVTGLVNRDFQL